MRHLRRNRRTPKQRLRVRRPQLDVISAQRHQAMIVPSDFVLDPGGMDLLNLSDSIFCEFVHTASMDSRRAYRSARPQFGHLFRQTLSLSRFREAYSCGNQAWLLKKEPKQ